VCVNYQIYGWERYGMRTFVCIQWLGRARRHSWGHTHTHTSSTAAVCSVCHGDCFVAESQLVGRRQRRWHPAAARRHAAAAQLCLAGHHRKHDLSCHFGRPAFGKRRNKSVSNTRCHRAMLSEQEFFIFDDKISRKAQETAYPAFGGTGVFGSRVITRDNAQSL
jgi:hypothetical protein